MRKKKEEEISLMHIVLLAEEIFIASNFFQIIKLYS